MSDQINIESRQIQRQVGAVPCRDSGEGLRVMLVTSRETRRWVIPKGWPKKRLHDSEMAALEAYEEAGLKGCITREPIGHYRYLKRLAGGGTTVCEVAVYRLDVGKTLKDWPERNARQRKWFKPAAAAGLVEEPDLAAILLSLAAVPPNTLRVADAVITNGQSPVFSEDVTSVARTIGAGTAQPLIITPAGV